MNKPHTAYLGLGSNLSNPQQQIENAITWIETHPKITILAKAPDYKTPAWGVTQQPDFINSALAISTTLSPHQLLSFIKDIEYKKMKRIKSQRWHERIIDIDILLYNHWQIHTIDLIIPHPLICERWFVILPLLTLQPKLPIKLAQTIQTKLTQEKVPEEIILVE